MERLTPTEAAARIRPTDTFGMPLGPGQPVDLLTEMGTRDDWEDLNVYGALLTVFTDLFNHRNVHYLSGFFGPLDRALPRRRGERRLQPGRLPPLRAPAS